MSGGYWPEIFAGAVITAAFTALYVMWRTGYRDGFEAGRQAERNQRNTAAIQANRAPAQWAQWEAELRMTQPIAHGSRNAIQAAGQPDGRAVRPAGAHAVTRPRNTSTTLIGSGITVPTGTGEMRALQAQTDEYIARMSAEEDAYRRGMRS